MPRPTTKIPIVSTNHRPKDGPAMASAPQRDPDGPRRPRTSWRWTGRNWCWSWLAELVRGGPTGSFADPANPCRSRVPSPPGGFGPGGRILRPMAKGVAPHGGDRRERSDSPAVAVAAGRTAIRGDRHRLGHGPHADRRGRPGFAPDPNPVGDPAADHDPLRNRSCSELAQGRRPDRPDRDPGREVRGPGARADRSPGRRSPGRRSSSRPPRRAVGPPTARTSSIAYSTRLKTPIRLLTPEREAELGFAGVRADLPTRGELVVVDSGGASTEVTLTRGPQFQRATSLPVGAARLATQLVGDPPDPIDWALVAVSIGATLPSLPAGKPRHAYATGGTAHGLLAVGTLAVSHSAADRATISLAELDRIAGLLLDRPSRRIGAAAQVDPRQGGAPRPGHPDHRGDPPPLWVDRADRRPGGRARGHDPGTSPPLIRAIGRWGPAHGFPPVAAAPPAAVPQPVGPIAAS